VRRLLRIAAVLAVGVLLSSACGDDDDEPASSGTTVTTVAPGTTTTSAGTTTSVADDVDVLVVLNPDGLGFTTADSGSISRLDFGSDQQLVVDAVTKSLGEPIEEGTQAECGQGPRDSTRWDDLSLLHDGGSFVGWSISAAMGSTLTTADGIGLGTALEDLEAALGPVEITEGSLGREFTAGSYYGILNETEDVVDFLSAGETCVFR
jgi:hypothetical protein